MTNLGHPINELDLRASPAPNLIIRPNFPPLAPQSAQTPWCYSSPTPPHTPAHARRSTNHSPRSVFQPPSTVQTALHSAGKSLRPPHSAPGSAQQTGSGAPPCAPPALRRAPASNSPQVTKDMHTGTLASKACRRAATSGGLFLRMQITVLVSSMVIMETHALASVRRRCGRFPARQ